MLLFVYVCVCVYLSFECVQTEMVIGFSVLELFHNNCWRQNLQTRTLSHHQWMQNEKKKWFGKKKKVERKRKKRKYGRNLPRFSTDALISRMVRVYLVEAREEPGGLDRLEPSGPGACMVWLLWRLIVGKRATKDVLCLKLDEARLRKTKYINKYWCKQ